MLQSLPGKQDPLFYWSLLSQRQRSDVVARIRRNPSDFFPTAGRSSAIKTRDVTSAAIYSSGTTVALYPSLCPPPNECYLTLIVCFHNDNGQFFASRRVASSCFRRRRALRHSDEASSGMSLAIRPREHVPSCITLHLRPIGSTDSEILSDPLFLTP